MAQRKIDWLKATGGIVVIDDGTIAIIAKNKQLATVDIWGRVTWKADESDEKLLTASQKLIQ